MSMRSTRPSRRAPAPRKSVGCSLGRRRRFSAGSPGCRFAAWMSSRCRRPTTSPRSPRWPRQPSLGDTSGRGFLPPGDAVAVRVRPRERLVCLRPAVIAAASRRFVAAFPGDVLYAVKCNPEPRVLRAVWAGGVHHFDCASLPEIALVRKLLPGAEGHFMHPVKARHAIHAAFHEHDVTDFTFYTAAELENILQDAMPAGLVR